MSTSSKPPSETSDVIAAEKAAASKARQQDAALRSEMEKLIENGDVTGALDAMRSERAAAE